MLQEVQRLAAVEPPGEPPAPIEPGEPPAAAEATITIESEGAVRVIVVNKTPPPSIKGEL
jgi:hypothetical protein